MKIKITFLCLLVFLILVNAAPTLSQSQGRPFQGCIVTIEPIREGEDSSRVVGRQCYGNVTEFNQELSATANYIVVSFFNNTNYVNQLIVYSGPSTCTSGSSYGVADVGASLNDRFESAYTNYTNSAGCHKVTVYENIYYNGALLQCDGRSSCNTFGILNNQVSSWKAQRP